MRLPAVLGLRSLRVLLAFNALGVGYRITSQIPLLDCPPEHGFHELYVLVSSRGRPSLRPEIPKEQFQGVSVIVLSAVSPKVRSVPFGVKALSRERYDRSPALAGFPRRSKYVSPNFASVSTSETGSDVVSVS